MADTTQELEVHFTITPDSSVKVGTLAQRKHKLFFEYDAGWLERGLELSPFTLPAKPGLLEHTDRQFGPLFGLFDDSLPDGWGLLLIDRYFRKLGMEPSAIGLLERLAYLNTRTMGALTYHPPADRKDSAATIFELHELARQSQEIYAGQARDVLPELLRAGGSPGGARPKILVGYNPVTGEIISGEDNLPAGFEHWIVKFSAKEDAADAGPVEYAYSLMAQASGIDMPETRLFKTSQGDRFFGVKRFDRAAGNRRFHVHTFGNLIHANFRIPSCDYADLLKATTILTRNHTDVLRAFRLMAFNVQAHNRDDHAKNFAFFLDDTTGLWSLSPTYDLTYTTGPGGEHTTTVNGEGKAPDRDHMLQLARQFDIATTDANSIIDEVFATIAQWPTFAAQAAVPQQAAMTISKKIIGPPKNPIGL